VAERAGVPLVIDVAVDDSILEQGYKNSFRIQPNATSMGTDGAQDLIALAEASGKPVESVSYIHIEGAFGQSVFDAFQAVAEANGVEVLSEVTYPGSNFTDATTQVREAAAADPDAIVVTGYYPDSLLIAQAVEALGPEIDALYGVANGAFDDGAFPGDAGEAGNQVLSAMETASMLSYQAVEVIAQALEEAASTDPQDVRDAIAEIEVADPLLAFDGPITFDETGQNENATVIVMQVQDGAVQQVFPEDFQTGTPVYPTTS
jgi:branched-chain amino acid transport system substrate-binding protein